MENDAQAYQLKRSIIELTTSGKDKLNETTLKQVKKICKKSDAYVVELYKLVTKQLRKKHAEIRFSAFQICDEIFRRSHIFRELLLKDFNGFVDLVLGLNPDRPLPKPDAVAKQLKQKGVEVIHQWYTAFGEGYIPLKLGYTFLRDCKRVDFAELTARTEAERQRAEEERRRTEEIKRKKIEKINNELEESSSEIQDCIVQYRNCFSLLIPDVHDFFIVHNEDEESTQEGGFMNEQSRTDQEGGFEGSSQEGGFIRESNSTDQEGGFEESSQEGGFIRESNSTDQEGGFIHSDSEEQQNDDVKYGSEYMRGHGIVKGTNVQINLEDVRKLQETADNEILIANLKEYVHILSTKYFPKVKSWEQTMRPYSEGNVQLIKRIIDIKRSVQAAVKRFESLRIIPREKPRPVNSAESDTDDDDDDFIEVPMDDPRVVRAAKSEAALLGLDKTRSCQMFSMPLPDDPFSQPSTSSTSGTSLPTSGREKSSKKSHTPRCPDEYLSKVSYTPKRHTNPLAGLSQVWTSTAELHEQEEVDSTGGVLGVATQRVNYERTWEPVKWACRAPLKSGGLCPRKDREKCPLHGPIVPRDEVGQPLRPEDVARERAAREQYERDHPAWQDPALLAELKAATGVDLKVRKGRRNCKRKYENLTDIKKTTSRDRLAKKIFSPKAMRRLNNALSREHSSAPTESTFRFGQG